MSRQPRPAASEPRKIIEVHRLAAQRPSYGREFNQGLYLNYRHIESSDASTDPFSVGQPLQAHNNARAQETRLLEFAGNSALVPSMLRIPQSTSPPLPSRTPSSKVLHLRPVPPSTAGTADVEAPGPPRPNGLLSRLAGRRARVRAASPTGEGSDQVHPATPLPIGTRLGTFEVAGVLDRDLSGVVYAGDDRSRMGKVAIKEYLPATLADRMANGRVGLRSLRYKQSFQEGKERFLSNGRMLAALDEPALIRVLRCWKQHGTAYMAMPLYEGQTLGDVLRASPRPGEAWLKSLLGPLLDALATLHRFDCYPCNVTPDNIVVLQDGTPLLFAFGAGRRTTANASGDLRGDLNPGFAPIEQYAHDPTMPEGPWTDIHAVAAVIRFAITGKPLPALAARMASDTLPSLRDGYEDYSAGFLETVDRSLTLLPRDRPQTIAEFRAALGIHQLASGAPAMARHETPSRAKGSAAETAEVSPESPPMPQVDEPEETRVTVPTVEPNALPPVSPVFEHVPQEGVSQATMQTSPVGPPWKLVVQVAVVGLSALGLLIWAVVERRQPPPSTIDHASAPSPPVSASAQSPSPPVAAPPATTASVAPAVGVLPPVVDPAPQPRPLPDAAAVATAPGIQTKAVATAPPAPQVGRIRFSIIPWGEIIVDGKSRGVSPPVKELAIPEGRHRIQVRNGDFPGYDSQVEIKAGSKGEISYSFKAP